MYHEGTGLKNSVFNVPSYTGGLITPSFAQWHRSCSLALCAQWHRSCSLAFCVLCGITVLYGTTSSLCALWHHSVLYGISASLYSRSARSLLICSLICSPICSFAHLNTSCASRATRGWDHHGAASPPYSCFSINPLLTCGHGPPSPLQPELIPPRTDKSSASHKCFTCFPRLVVS